ncbi:CPBP family intramembrane glutamic endopeptidase [Clostridium sp.]|uniref:CPBP family intramembrane glutamic endopeptidase n=1 Tax=Clostridium sp. TaxID=1506 RepID=UPI00260C260C|nr:CPBP family intramembrane glutamic endopeptidase [Clostridium sp.]
MNYNEAKIMRKSIKREFNKLGLAILMKELIANIVIFICMLVIMVIELLKQKNVDKLDFEKIVSNPTYIGIMSIIAAIISISPFLIYRGRKFFNYDLRVENKKFKLKTVVLSIIVLLSVNSALVLFSNGLEHILNLMGLSANSALEALESLNELTVPTIIYSCLVAPVVEELIFRGAVLRSLEKYGKRFAILISGLLFGLMHGNFFQIFMAMGVGIILGYLAIEYSIKLTILLHIINNVCVEILSQISTNVSGNKANIIDLTITVVSVIVLVIAFIRNKNNIKEWLLENRIEKGIMFKFFTSILVILVIAFDLFEVIVSIQRIV